MPRNGSGVYSKPANTTAISGQTISSTYYNTLMDDIGDELTASLPVDGSAAMTGTLKLPDGTVSAPAAQFSAASTTGFYRTASGIGVAVSGTKVAEFTSAGALNGSSVGYSAPTIAWADVASAATVDLGAQTSDNLRITGTTTITGLGTVASGTKKTLRFAAALTLTYNATSLILPGAASITTAADDTAVAVSLGSGNWIITDYQKASGQAVVANTVTGYTVRQVVENAVGTVATGSTAIPHDNTIPQNTEGSEILSQAITPASASSVLVIEVTVMGANSAAAFLTAALFQDSTANALAAMSQYVSSANETRTITYSYKMAAGTTSATTFKVRLGSSTGTYTFNGSNSTQVFGGVAASRLRITEYL